MTVDTILKLIRNNVKLKLSPKLMFSPHFGRLDNFINWLLCSSLMMVLLRRFVPSPFIDISLQSKTLDGQKYYRDFFSPLPQEFCWEEYLKNFDGQLKLDGAVVVDLGGHLGYFSLRGAFLHEKCRFFCVEPSKSNFNNLTKTCRSISSKNVVLANYAICRDNDEKSFIDGGSSTTGALETANFFLNTARKHKKSTVLGITFPKFMEQYNIDKIDILKCDIEGGEYDAFEGCFGHLLSIKYLIFELHESGDALPRETALYKFIIDNFNVVERYPSKYHQDKVIEMFATQK